MVYVDVGCCEINLLYIVCMYYISVCRGNKLKISNGFLRHKDICMYTWHLISRNLKDYIIIREKTGIVTRDVRAHRRVTCGLNHYI